MSDPAGPPPAAAVRMLLVSGSTRSASTNTAFCRTAAAAPPPELRIEALLDCAVLPHFNPDLDADPLPAPVAALRASVAAADVVLLCTPEYAGTLPGSLKNLLDWMVGGTEFTHKPVAWVNVAADAHRGGGAHAALATVLGYVQARILPAAGLHVPVPHHTVTADGVITDRDTRAAITAALELVRAQASA